MIEVSKLTDEAVPTHMSTPAISSTPENESNNEPLASPSSDPTISPPAPLQCMICLELIPDLLDEDSTCGHHQHAHCKQAFIEDRIMNKRLPVTCPDKSCE